MRILLVSYYFPPFNSVGAVRPGKLARFLELRGHDVTVLTCSDQPYLMGMPVEIAADKVVAVPGWSINAPVEWLRGGRTKVAETGFAGADPPSSTLGMLGRLYKVLFHWPDAQVGWVRSALKAGRVLLSPAPYDLIYVSAPPFSGLRIASALAKEFEVPWIAELRDLWTDNHAYAFPAWRLAIERRWEARLLSSASALVTVSPPLADQLAKLGLPVWQILNGCDPEDFDNAVHPTDFVHARDCLNIVFTGNIYEEHYDVDAFCESLAQYVLRGGKAQVHIAGRNIGAFRGAVRRHGVEDIVKFRNSISRASALGMQRSADVLLTFLWDGGEGIYSAKLFEYASAGRPILAVGDPSSDVGALIEAAGLGRAHGTVETLTEQLLFWRQEKKEAGDLQVVPKRGYDFSRRAQFLLLEEQLAKILAM